MPNYTCALRCHLRRWRVLAAGILVESIGGLFYAFSLYSDQLRERFMLTETQVLGIGSAALVGGSVGVCRPLLLLLLLLLA